MPNHGNALHSKQRRAARFGIIDFLTKLLESRPGQKISQLRPPTATKLFLQNFRNLAPHPFANLQGDVTDETVADDDVDIATENIAAFHVADKVEGGLFEQRCRLPGELIAFHLLFTYGKQRHAWLCGAKNGAIVNLAHDRKLFDLRWFRIDVRAHIDDHGHGFLRDRKSTRLN